MKGLFILTNYKPQLNAAAIQNERLMKGLAGLGAGGTIVTSQPSDDHMTFDLVAVPMLRMKILRHVLRNYFPAFYNTPDFERYAWVPGVRRRLASTGIVAGHQWIHTSSSPFSSHMLGVSLKEKFALPLVAQFLDPWVDNNYRIIRGSLFRRMDAASERKVAEAADLIIHTNHIVAERWEKRYGAAIASRIAVIPLCTDERIIPFSDHVPGTRLRILHAGGIYGRRKLDLLIDALLQLRKEGIAPEEKLEFILIGISNPVEINKIKSSGLSGAFTIHGRSPFSFLLEQYEKADLLLNIDALGEDSVFFPSKLCEYFSFRKPIIGISPVASISTIMLKESGHLVINDGESSKLAAILKQLAGGGPFPEFDREYYRHFLPDVVARQYLEALKKHQIIP